MSEPSPEITPKLAAQHALDVLEIGVFVLDADLTFVAWNAWMSRHADRREADVLGQPFERIFPQMATHRLGRAISQALRYGMASMLSQALHVAPLPLYPEGASGFGARRIDQMIQIRPIGSKDQRQCVVEIHDVTATARRERQLRQQAKRLEELARAAELARDEARLKARQLSHSNDALNRARDEALSISRTHDEFLMQMGQQIHRPLDKIMGALALLDQITTHALGRGQLSQAHQAAAQLGQLMEDVLDLQHMKITPTRPQITTFEIEQIKAKALDAYGLQAQRKGLALSVRLDPALPTQLVGDQEALLQILGRLLDNAIKFTEFGEITLRIRGAQEEGEEGAIRLQCSVQDTGPGIPEKARRRLFDPFFQLDDGDKGGGMGLALCLKQCEQLGGRLWMDSELSRGSTFHFVVPMRAPVVHHAPAPRPWRFSRPTPLRPLEILLTQEDLIGQQHLERQLTERGHTVITAPDAYRSLEAFTDNRFDVVLLEASLCRQDGVNLPAQLKGRGRGHQTIVVAFNAPLDQIESLLDDDTLDLAVRAPLDLEMLERSLLAVLPHKAAGQAQQVL